MLKIEAERINQQSKEGTKKNGSLTIEATEMQVGDFLFSTKLLIGMK